jgi:hypothetical protein
VVTGHGRELWVQAVISDFSFDLDLALSDGQRDEFANCSKPPRGSSVALGPAVTLRTARRDHTASAATNIGRAAMGARVKVQR